MQCYPLHSYFIRQSCHHTVTGYGMIYWNRDIITMTRLPSLQAPLVVILTAFDTMCSISKITDKNYENNCSISLTTWPVWEQIFEGKLTVDQGWRVLDGTRFLPWYLPVNTVLGKTGFGHPKWEKLGKTQLYISKRLNRTLKYINIGINYSYLYPNGV